MNLRKGFSLIELLIVILIIGVVYTLAIGNFQRLQEGETKLSLQNLKTYLMQFPHEQSVELLCLERCSKCDIFVDGKLSKELEVENFLDESVQVYRYEYALGTIKEPRETYFNSEDVEEEVCFSYSVDKKGVGKQVLVEFQNNVYDFSSYFTPTPKYNSLEEAVSEKERVIEEVLR